MWPALSRISPGFDTDLIGRYGICSDISGTWFLGDQEPTKEMKEDYQLALEHITTNMNLMKQVFPRLTFKGHQLPDLYQKRNIPAVSMALVFVMNGR